MKRVVVPVPSDRLSPPMIWLLDDLMLPLPTPLTMEIAPTAEVLPKTFPETKTVLTKPAPNFMFTLFDAPPTTFVTLPVMLRPLTHWPADFAADEEIGPPEKPPPLQIWLAKMTPCVTEQVEGIGQLL
jgi:hypothetical protein